MKMAETTGGSGLAKDQLLAYNKIAGLFAQSPQFAQCPATQSQTAEGKLALAQLAIKDISEQVAFITNRPATVPDFELVLKRVSKPKDPAESVSIAFVDWIQEGGLSQYKCEQTLTNKANKENWQSPTYQFNAQHTTLPSDIAQHSSMKQLSLINRATDGLPEHGIEWVNQNYAQTVAKNSELDLDSRKALRVHIARQAKNLATQHA